MPRGSLGLKTCLRGMAAMACAQTLNSERSLIVPVIKGVCVLTDNTRGLLVPLGQVQLNISSDCRAEHRCVGHRAVAVRPLELVEAHPAPAPA
jgi:hypothetical protein